MIDMIGNQAYVTTTFCLSNGKAAKVWVSVKKNYSMLPCHHALNCMLLIYGNTLSDRHMFVC